MQFDRNFLICYYMNIQKHTEIRIEIKILRRLFLSMFSNKKTKLPPRPNIPDAEHMLEDLGKAPMDDIVFKITNTDEISGKNTISVNTSDTYQKVKIHLNIKQQLRHLQTTLERKGEQLRADNEEIKTLANDIKKQAQDALIT